MKEFLIKRVDGDWFDFPKGSNPYQPIGLDFVVIGDCGEYRIECRGSQISFSYEDPGIHVVFEGSALDDEEYDEIILAIMKNIERTSNQKAQILEL